MKLKLKILIVTAMASIGALSNFIRRTVHDIKLEARSGYVRQQEQQQMANTWPATSGTTVGFIQTGSNRIGTDGLLQSPKPSTGFYVVTDFEEEVDVETEYLTNGTGIKANRLTFIHGGIWNITVRDDVNMTPPAINSAVNITDADCVIPGNTNPQAVYTANVRKASYKTSPKQAGERIITVENLTLIDSQTPVAAV